MSPGMSAAAPHVQCECADRQFIDVYSCKAPAGEGQRLLSQMDDNHKDEGREGGFCRQPASVNFCLSLCPDSDFFFSFFFSTDRGVCFGEWRLGGTTQGQRQF